MRPCSGWNATRAAIPMDTDAEILASPLECADIPMAAMQDALAKATHAFGHAFSQGIVYHSSDSTMRAPSGGASGL